VILLSVAPGTITRLLNLQVTVTTSVAAVTRSFGLTLFRNPDLLVAIGPDVAGIGAVHNIEWHPGATLSPPLGQLADQGSAPWPDFWVPPGVWELRLSNDTTLSLSNIRAVFEIEEPFK
jgi:hypothetical protein